MGTPSDSSTPVLLPRGRLHARGVDSNPANRFERLHYADAAEPEGDPSEAELAPLRTRFYKDASRSALTRNRSPDVPFDVSLNPYRGCEHACVYCYARPTHEYLGFSAGFDFESRILVKEDAPLLLRQELGSPRWAPQTVAIGGVTDAYQPVERRLRLTRSCLEVFAEFRNPVALVTKGCLVLRDLDLLSELAGDDAAAVYVSVTTLNEDLRRVMEPRAASVRSRIRTLRALARAGIPVGVMVAPVIPGLTDSEIPAIVDAAARAGACSASHITLRLPHGLSALFEHWLERHFPERRAKVMNRVRALRGGRLNDPHFHSRMRGSGVFAEQIEALFEMARRRAGLAPRLAPLSTRAFRSPEEPQVQRARSDPQAREVEQLALI